MCSTIKHSMIKHSTIKPSMIKAPESEADGSESLKRIRESHSRAQHSTQVMCFICSPHTRPAWIYLPASHAASLALSSSFSSLSLRGLFSPVMISPKSSCKRRVLTHTSQSTEGMPQRRGRDAVTQAPAPTPTQAQARVAAEPNRCLPYAHGSSRLAPFHPQPRSTAWLR